MRVLPQVSGFGVRFAVVVSAVGVAIVSSACGGATRRPAETRVTAGTMLGGDPLERILVAEPNQMSMIVRSGCVATVRTTEAEVGTNDELRVRCPKKERIRAWFEGVDKITSTLALEVVKSGASSDADADEAPTTLPAAKLVSRSGKVLGITKLADVNRLTHEIQAFIAELAAVEQPAPGPASPAGWQMFRVTGPAHVVFGGTPAHGVLEAKLSTNGQYICDFVANVGDEGPLHATKSGWLAEATAAHVIDEVLAPFSAEGTSEHTKQTYAAAVSKGTEQRSNPSSTSAVFERFSRMQSALGDACLPELEAEASSALSL